MNQQGMVARGAELEQLHGALGVVQNQCRIPATEPDVASGSGNIHGFGVAEGAILAAAGRHDVQDGVLGHEITAGSAEVLGSEEQPFPVLRLADIMNALGVRGGHRDLFRFPAANAYPVNAAYEVFILRGMEGGHEVHALTVRAEGLAGMVRGGGCELLRVRKSGGNGWFSWRLGLTLGPAGLVLLPAAVC